MDIKEFEKNLGEFPISIEKALQYIAIQNANILGNQEAILRNQSKIMHDMNPSVNETEHMDRSNEISSVHTKEVWITLLRDSVKPDKEG